MQSRVFLINNIAFFVLPRILLVVFVFIASIVVLPYYFEGDQVHYRNIYTELSNLSLVEGYNHYNISLSSYELVHFFLTWVFSRIVEKDIFVALFNAVLALLIILNFDKKRVRLIVTILFVVSNFYLLVLFFAAERLKFGMIFFLLSVYYFDRMKIFGLFSFLSIISHAQFIIIYTGILFSWMVKKSVRLYRTGMLSLYVIYIFVFGLVLVFLMWNQIQTKFIAYFEVRDVYEFLRMSVFFLMAQWYSRKKQQTFFVFIPLFIAVLLFGGERLNIFGYFVFLYYALPINRGVNFGILISSTYFAYSSYGFLSNIVNYGDGFYAG